MSAFAYIVAINLMFALLWLRFSLRASRNLITGEFQAWWQTGIYHGMMINPLLALHGGLTAGAWYALRHLNMVESGAVFPVNAVVLILVLIAAAIVYAWIFDDRAENVNDELRSFLRSTENRNARGAIIQSIRRQNPWSLPRTPWTAPRSRFSNGR